MWFGHGYGWGGMIFGGIMMLLIWGCAIALIFWGVRYFASNKNTPSKDSPSNAISAREILDRRYAGGEINRDEYEAIKEDLER